MRFVIAALIAWAALGTDFDKLNRPPVQRQAPTGEHVTDSRAAPSNTIRLADVTSLANAAASEESIEPPALNASLPEKTFCEALKEAAEASEIPLPFFARLLWQESRFQSSEVSPAGAQGVAQFMPSTAAEVGLDDPFDPFKALPASARYLRQLHREFGNLGLAAAAYNAGSGRVQKWLSGRGKLPQETRIYVRRITGTSAENWVEEASTVSLRQELPDHAPCEGVGGLSRMNELATVPVALTPSISEICRKAKAEAQRREAENSLALIRSRTQHPSKKDAASSRGLRAGARGAAKRQAKDAISGLGTPTTSV